LNNLGKAWGSLCDYNIAIEYFKQALLINETNYGEKHPKLSETMVNLGEAYFHINQKSKAKNYFVKAYQIFSDFFGPQHPHIKVVDEWLQECR
jgi:tetratricopeptide (TPR) repeat protein